MKKIIAILSISIVLFSNCQNPKTNTNESNSKSSSSAKVANSENYDILYQYSIWYAFVNKVFDGDLKVKELQAHGDIGLGSFDFLNGELVMLNGVTYRVRENGEISEGKPDDEVVYSVSTFFQKNGEFNISNSVNYESFKNELSKLNKTPQYFYAYKAHGTFKSIKLGGIPKVNKPFTEGLDVLIPKRPVFNAENITGTLVGFYCPDYIGDINAKGFHFHFISDDKKFGGHAMDFVVDNSIVVEWNQKTSYQFDLPTNSDFENVKLEKAFQYNK